MSTKKFLVRSTPIVASLTRVPAENETQVDEIELKVFRGNHKVIDTSIMRGEALLDGFEDVVSTDEQAQISGLLIAEWINWPAFSPVGELHVLSAAETLRQALSRVAPEAA